ncbi:hypothetical protein Plhal710r2_c037g0132371 [Plasmopara halstedii]
MLSNRQDLMRLRSICPNGRAIATIRFDGKWKSRAGLSTRIVTIFAARCRTENISRSPTIKQIKVRRSQAHLRCRC